MGRVQNTWDQNEESRVLRQRNQQCSANLLEALRANHGSELEIEIVDPEPSDPEPADPEPEPIKALPPVPQEAIAAAIEIAFPPYLSRIKTIQIATLTQFPKMTRAELTSHRRTASVVRARQISMYLAKTLTEQSLPEIGRRFGGRDHTTVLHAVRKIERLIQTDSDLAAQVERIKEIIPEAL